jgi:hypothetical protein
MEPRSTITSFSPARIPVRKSQPTPKELGFHQGGLLLQCSRNAEEHVIRRYPSSPITSKFSFTSHAEVVADWQKKSHIIANPYYASPKTFTTTGSYLMRVPRRMRPAILAGFCFFVIVTVFFSRAVTQASQMDIMMAQRRASLLERRFVEDGLMNINTAEQAEVGHEAVLEVTHEKTEAFPLTAFASPKDELLALISVSPFISQSRRYMLIISSSLLLLQTLYLLLIPNNHYLLNPSSTLIHPEQTLLKISNS